MIREMMIACRSLTKRGRNNGIKILSLATGLAMGLILIAKVCFEQSYDTFYPDAERIYRLNSRAVQNGELKEYPQVSGAVAFGMKEEVVGVETATRCTWIALDEKVYTDDKKSYKADIIAADEYFFDVLPRRMVVGDAKDLLTRPDYMLVSQELADKLGGNAVGRTMRLHSGRKFTIGGVFETVPENTHLHYDVIVSLNIMKNANYDGTMNWLGNDRYLGYVKLRPGVTPESLVGAMHTMQTNHQDMEKLKEAGVELSYTLSSLPALHSSLPNIKRMMWLLGLLAFALLFTAVMNYVLIVISSLVGRSKEVAVHKCYGASGVNIHGMIMSETFVHLLLSLVLSLLLIFAFRGTVEELLSASFGALFTSRSLTILGGIFAIVFFVAGILPGNLFARIPVAVAFRSYRENRRRWKLALLFVQFIAVGFLISLLLVITRQYDYMTHDNPGYCYDNLAYFNMQGADSTLRAKFVDEVRALPEVKDATTFSQLPFDWASGNNVYLPNDKRELFNIADLYFVGNEYLSIMEITLLMGHSFTENVSSSHEVMVSRKFVEKMKNFVDWSDGPVGKEIVVTEHSGRERNSFVICGVYDDIRLGSISGEDMRPSVMFYSTNPLWTSGRYLLIKFHRMTPESMQHVRETLQRLMPDRDVVVSDWRFEMTSMYRSSRRFRDSVMIGCVITLIIALIGLIGYTRDEINRRRKEIALRKINGATVKEVMRLFETDIIRMALPALAFGGVLAAYVATRWQTGFSEKVPLTWYLFVICGLIMLAVIVCVVAFNVRNAANENPVKSLRSE